MYLNWACVFFSSSGATLVGNYIDVCASLCRRGMLCKQVYRCACTCVTDTYMTWRLIVSTYMRMSRYVRYDHPICSIANRKFISQCLSAKRGQHLLDLVLSQPFSMRFACFLCSVFCWCVCMCSPVWCTLAISDYLVGGLCKLRGISRCDISRYASPGIIDLLFTFNRVFTRSIWHRWCARAHAQRKSLDQIAHPSFA